MGTTATSGGSSPPQPSTNDLVFGKYQIIRRLAVGGMGEVFLARQSGGVDRLVILKSLLPDLAGQDDSVDQFLDEARVAATLNHPNIVSIYEVGQHNGTYFIAMEYIRGDNLSRLQRAAERAKVRIPVEVAAFIIHDAAHALDNAHQATDLHGRALAIVHRDVSPQNIMVRTDGVTKVVDFGIAKAANRSSRTATGLLKGKVQYMAPEQVQGEALDGRVDQFALGVVLWELVAGRKLFTGANELDILRSVLKSPIAKLSAVVADVPPALEAVVARMLERNRDDRYPTLADAAADLKRFLDATGMKNAQQQTTTFVKEILGEEITAKTMDLTPSGANNFVINLSQNQAPPTSPTMIARGLSSSRARLGVAAGGALALVLAAVTYVVVFVPPAPAPVLDKGPGTARVAVDSQPSGTVTVDGKNAGKTPFELNVTPGVEHTIEVTAPGYETRSEKVTLKAGDMKPMLWSLVQKKAEVQVTAVCAICDAVPPELKLDGKAVGKAPLELHDVVAGVVHEVRATASKGRESFAGVLSFTARPGEALTAVVKLEKVTGNGPVPCPPGQLRVNGVCRGGDAPASSAVSASGVASFTLATTPWAKLYVDGKYVDSTPVSKVELPAGIHKIHLVQEGAGVDETRVITLRPGEAFKQSWTLKAK